MRGPLRPAPLVAFLAALVTGATVVVLAYVTRSASMFAAAQSTGRGTTTPAGRAPRTLDGKPDLSGVWQNGGLGSSPGNDRLNLAALERLYQPWAREQMNKLTEDDDPTLRCIPYGFPRAITLPTNQRFQIVQSPGLVVVLNEYFHSFRIIPTDGRKHREDAFPTYMGDSVGRWEGDTLVVDVTTFNGKIWLADGADKPNPTSTGGWFTSDALHVVERWRRFDLDTLEYQATVEDPKVLTGPWTTPKVTVKRDREGVIEEAMCLDISTYLFTEKGSKERK